MPMENTLHLTEKVEDHVAFPLQDSFTIASTIVYQQLNKQLALSVMDRNFGCHRFCRSHGTDTIFPTFTYHHKFKNSEWEFDFILPSRVLLRRPVGNHGRISLVSTF